MRPNQPLTELLGGLIGCLPVERHQGCPNARRFHQTGPPAVRFDRCDLEQVGATGNRFLETMDSSVHSMAAARYAFLGERERILRFARERSSEARYESGV